jgi:hypothetical protein
MCPASPFVYRVQHPQGMDGGGPVDKALAELAASFLAWGQRTGQALDQSGIGCMTSDYGDDEDVTGMNFRGSPYLVSGTAYSALFLRTSNVSGAHADMGYTAVNILSDGTELTPERLFPDLAKSLPLLWEKVYRGYCRTNATAPRLYGAQICGEELPETPDILSPSDRTLDGMGHMLLTSLGLSVHLGPYEAYPYDEGPQFLDIPKEELTEIGADPEIWR